MRHTWRVFLAEKKICDETLWRIEWCCGFIEISCVIHKRKIFFFHLRNYSVEKKSTRRWKCWIDLIGKFKYIKLWHLLSARRRRRTYLFVTRTMIFTNESIFITILNSLGTNSYVDDNGTINYQFSRVASCLIRNPRFPDISRHSPELCAAVKGNTCVVSRILINPFLINDPCHDMVRVIRA